jgi:alpha-mannosidase
VYEKRPYAWDPETSVAVIEQGPVRLVVRVLRRRGATTNEQDMILWAEHPRIDWVTRADWHERQTLLKVAFPVAVRSEYAAYEVQFGAVRRPTHRNTSWEQEKFEVCAHRWMDLSEPGYGVSVLNDSRYGCDVHAHTLRLTLLRGPEWPDPEADQGRHELLYSLYPHRGDWTLAETVHRAAELNTPLLSQPPRSGAGTSTATRRAFLSIEGVGTLSALKRARNGAGWILRIYEPNGARGTATVTAPRAISSLVACNHVEEDAQPLPSQGAAFSVELQPFQVRTFRIRF